MNWNNKIDTTFSLRECKRLENTVSKFTISWIVSSVILISPTASYGFFAEEQSLIAFEAVKGVQSQDTITKSEIADSTFVNSSQNQLLEKLRAYAGSRYRYAAKQELIVKQPILKQPRSLLSDFNKASSQVVSQVVNQAFSQTSSQTSNGDFNKEDLKPYSKLSNALNRKLSQEQLLLAQTDSSGTVGDTFGEINKLRQDLLIEPIVIETRTQSRVAPASSAGTPTAYGASSRQAYIGGGVRFPFDGDRDRVDGSLSFGFGEGDAINSLGVEFNFNITSVGGGNFNDFDFGDSGTIGFKLHKYFGRGTAAAFGWSNPIRWGDTTAANATVYGVVTQAFPLLSDRLPLTISVGVGSGAFRSKGAILQGENTPNLFGSVGLQVTPEISLTSSWTGNRLNVGASVVPIRSIPLVINAIFTDVTDNLNEGSGLTIVAGSAFQF